MAQTTAKSGFPIRNVGGVVPRGGTVATGSPITVTTDGLVQGYTTKGVGGTAAYPATSANMGAIKAVSAGTFGRNMVAGQFLMTRNGFVGGAASTFLNSGAADFGRRSINFKTNRRTYHITSWNYETGAATYGAPTNDDFGSDHAAIPTRAIPGELTYTDHGMAKSGALAVPIADDYDAKTG